MTKIYPLNRNIADEIKNYRHIVFFEESCGEGSISEKIGTKLAECGYRGSYERVTASGYIKHASVSSILEKLGMSSEKIAEKVRNMLK